MDFTLCGKSLIDRPEFVLVFWDPMNVCILHMNHDFTVSNPIQYAREREWRIGSKAGKEMLEEGTRRFQRYSKETSGRREEDTSRTPGGRGEPDEEDSFLNTLFDALLAAGSWHM